MIARTTLESLSKQALQHSKLNMQNVCYFCLPGMKITFCLICAKKARIDAKNNKGPEKIK